jgi:hypothetical protein
MREVEHPGAAESAIVQGKKDKVTALCNGSNRVSGLLPELRTDLCRIKPDDSDKNEDSKKRKPAAVAEGIATKDLERPKVWLQERPSCRLSQLCFSSESQCAADATM